MKKHENLYVVCCYNYNLILDGGWLVWATAVSAATMKAFTIGWVDFQNPTQFSYFMDY